MILSQNISSIQRAISLEIFRLSDAETVTVTFIEEAGQITFCFILSAPWCSSHFWIEQFYLHILLSPFKLHQTNLELRLPSPIHLFLLNNHSLLANFTMHSGQVANSSPEMLVLWRPMNNWEGRKSNNRCWMPAYGTQTLHKTIACVFMCGQSINKKSW